MAYPKETKEKMIKNLVELMKRGVSLHEACQHLKYKYQTILHWRKNKKIDEELSFAETYLTVKAETVVADDIIVHNKVETAKWLLERVKKNKYSVRTEHTGEEGNPLFRGAKIVISPGSKENAETTNTQD